jgi:hypothetical protein
VSLVIQRTVPMWSLAVLRLPNNVWVVGVIILGRVDVLVDGGSGVLVLMVLRIDTVYDHAHKDCISSRHVVFQQPGGRVRCLAGVAPKQIIAELPGLVIPRRVALPRRG